MLFSLQKPNKLWNYQRSLVQLLPSLAVVAANQLVSRHKLVTKKLVKTPLVFMAVCAGCGAVITDRFLYQVCGNTWHCGCLRCADCGVGLTERCFVRDDRIFCRADFYRYELTLSHSWLVPFTLKNMIAIRWLITESATLNQSRFLMIIGSIVLWNLTAFCTLFFPSRFSKGLIPQSNFCNIFQLLLSLNLLFEW
jgi:hypothetical protein